MSAKHSIPNCKILIVIVSSEVTSLPNVSNELIKLLVNQTEQSLQMMACLP